MDEQKVTLSSIAEQLQLSRQSVSRALSGRPGVSEETRQKVMATLHELGYRHPNLNHHLGEPLKRSVLLLIAQQDVFHSEFWMEIVRGAEEEASRLGFHLVTRPFLASDGGKGEARSWEQFRGVIVAGRRAREVMRPYLEAGIPATLVTYPKPMEHHDTVMVADWEGGVAAGQHLRELGHKHVAFLTDVPDEMSRSERARGLRDALKGVEGGRVEELILAMEHPQVAFEKLYVSRVQRNAAPTAFFCATDSIAIIVLLVLQQLGVKVPVDVSVVGYNDTVNASLLKLTTLRPPLRKVGALAMQNLHRHMTEDNNGKVPRRLFLMPELIVRNTTGPAPVQAR